MSKILVTPRSVTQHGHPALSRLEQAGHELVFAPAGRQPSEAELVALLPGCAGYLAGVELITARVLEAARGLRVISRNGTGVNNVDLEAAQRLGIVVCRADGANARGVAELTVGLMFALVRSLPWCDAKLKQERWERRLGFELRGRTLGVIGCGRIGFEVSRLALALGMRVLAYDVVRQPTAGPGPDFQYVELPALLAGADLITLHCPPPADGQPLITHESLARMKPGVYLINTARAELVDEAAVLAALEAGRLAGFATDVFRREPPGADALLRHDRVIATPHIGAFTEESVDRAVTVAVENLLKHLQP